LSAKFRGKGAETLPDFSWPSVSSSPEQNIVRVIAGKAKIWKTPTAPLFIEVTDKFEIQPPQLETNPPDHRIHASTIANLFCQLQVDHIIR
jgi:hypothetical protein